MEITKNERKIIENNLVFLSSSSKKGVCHVIVCADAKVIDNKILITDNYMKTTKKNLLENKYVSLCVGSENSGFLYISGKADYKTSGKYFSFIKGLKENKGFPCKGFLIITCRKINLGR